MGKGEMGVKDIVIVKVWRTGVIGEGEEDKDGEDECEG